MTAPRHRTRRRLGVVTVVVLAVVCCVAAAVGVRARLATASSPTASEANTSTASGASASTASDASASATAVAGTSVASSSATGSPVASTSAAGTASGPTTSVSGPASSMAAGGVGAAAVPQKSGLPEQQPVTPTASDFAGTSAVGALFSGSVAGGHRCSASVVDSPGGDLILTAAHCVSGSGAGLLFVPAYDRGATPHGVWTVVAAYADPAWLDSQDPDHDYAFLRVADSEVSGEPATLESVAGGETLGLSPGEGDVVTVSGYAAGSDDDPISCTAAVTLTGPDPTFSCEGFVDGTSGSPWLSAGVGSTPTTVVGLIGGRRQGGCESDVSYSAPFDSDAVALWQRASAGGPSDTLPTPGASGCG